MTQAPGAPTGQGFQDAFDHWKRLNRWLSGHQLLWRPVPFSNPQPDWVALHPELASAIATFSDRDCAEFGHAPELLADDLASVMPSLAERASLVNLPGLAGDPDAVAASTLKEVHATDMPGRKRLQAGAFTAALQPLSPPLLDWCCGKGHLARTLAASCRGPVRGLEWDEALVDDGNRLARQFQDDVTVYHQDVMAPDLTLPGGIHGVALHACGDLHRRLIRKVADNGGARVSFSPCCYHLTAEHCHRPLSRRVADSPDALLLSRGEMRMAVQETVTAPARVRTASARVRAWRLGFDGLQRALRDIDEYLSVPSHPTHLGSGTFEMFCRWAATEKGLVLPSSTDFSFWEAFGEQRLGQVRRHELVRHLFRRPLELWMVLDYVLFLEECGYRVRLGHFCERSLTPRNLLVDAVRVCGSPPAPHTHP